MEFGERIRNMEAQGWRWVTMGAVRVLMTNGSQWAVGAKYDHGGNEDFAVFDNADDANDAYHRIANPYSVEIMEAAE